MNSSFSQLSTPKLKKLLLDRGRSSIGKRSELINRLETPVSYEPVNLIFFPTGASLFGKNQCGIYFVWSLRHQIENVLKEYNIRNKVFVHTQTRFFFETDSPVARVSKLFPEYDSVTWNNYNNDFVDPELILKE